MLIARGVTTDPSVAVPQRKQRDKSCDKLYAFDPTSEAITPLADCPTALAPPAWPTTHATTSS